mgnify:CR=1 FL=1
MIKFKVESEDETEDEDRRERKENIIRMMKQTRELN